LKHVITDTSVKQMMATRLAMIEYDLGMALLTFGVTPPQPPAEVAVSAPGSVSSAGAGTSDISNGGSSTGGKASVLKDVDGPSNHASGHNGGNGGGRGGNGCNGRGGGYPRPVLQPTNGNGHGHGHGHGPGQRGFHPHGSHGWGHGYD